jgi:hypothetical protein
VLTVDYVVDHGLAGCCVLLLTVVAVLSRINGD